MIELGMIGAFLNGLGVLLGGLFGFVPGGSPSPRSQDVIRRALGAAAIFCGLRLVWLHVNGTFLLCSRQIFLAVLALVLGNWTGKLLRLQRISNRLGRFAGNLISSAQPAAPRKTADGFIACTVLFCAAPLGLLGAATEGLSGDVTLFAVKSVMDALAMAGFVKTFGWPAAFSAFPVYAFLGCLTVACRLCVAPMLAANGTADIVPVAAGFIACVVALVILDVRKVELANYLPGLVLAPVLARLLR